eukprot:scaffold17545_cov81-Skeletonema_dohrnii-CCMP3373.AAC.6
MPSGSVPAMQGNGASLPKKPERSKKPKGPRSKIEDPERARKRRMGTSQSSSVQYVVIRCHHSRGASYPAQYIDQVNIKIDDSARRRC